MRWVVVLALAIAAGCYRPGNDASCALTCATASDCPSDFVCTNNRCATSEGACDVLGDGGVDDAPPVMVCAGRPEGFDPDRCFVKVRPKNLTGDIKIDTDTDAGAGGFCDPSVATACYVVGDPLAVSGIVSATGMRPLVLWSGSSLEVTGTIDVGSHIGGLVGPAANPPNCNVVNGVSNNMSSPLLGAGGAGGSSHFAGGLGGDGRSNTAMVNAIGMSATTDPSALRGGCPGGDGGLSSLTGGAGGGAIYLMARTTIKIVGTIGAGGAGGGPGTHATNARGGGGGGGSGGMIAFDAAEIVYEANATISALGGGGGSGSSGGTDGNKAQDGDLGFPIAPAPGGFATATNNAGGQGSSVLGSGATNGGDVLAGNEGGGGGGGGGAGYILEFVGKRQAEATSTFAPPPGP